MYKSRGQLNRLKDLMQQTSLAKDSHIELSPTQVELIENSNALNISEKLELILISLGEKLTGEIAVRAGIPNSKTQIRTLLESLLFPFYQDQVNDRFGKDIQWFQISVNPAVSYFMQTYSESLTEMELGILYGFPTSSIRAFANLTEQYQPEQRSIAEYYLAGVFSKDHYHTEKSYFEDWWEKIRQISPQIIREAEENFAKINHDH